MQILRESNFFGFTSCSAGEKAGLAVLEDGTWLIIGDDGTGVDQNGKRYVCVSKEVEAEPIPADDVLLMCLSVEEDWDKPLPESFPIPDTDLVTLGWTPDADTPVIFPLER